MSEFRQSELGRSILAAYQVEGQLNDVYLKTVNHTGLNSNNFRGESSMLKRTLSLGLSLFLLSAAASLAQIKMVHAYIDLGTGSFLLQMLLATVFASLFTIKVFWSRLTKRVSQFISRSNKED